MADGNPNGSRRSRRIPGALVAGSSSGALADEPATEEAAREEGTFKDVTDRFAAWNRLPD